MSGGRTITPALEAELVRPITSVGYFIHVNFPIAGDLYWSNIGAQTWNSISWLDRDFTVSGLRFDADEVVSANIKIPNMAKAGETLPSDIFMGGDRLYETPVTIYQFAAGALAVADVVKLAVLAINSAKVSASEVVLSLGELKLQGGFSPIRKINNTFGFKFCQPPGTRVIWGGETLVVGEKNG